ncbi:hypothetical protein D3C72_1231360 [compost metagenome]
MLIFPLFTINLSMTILDLSRLIKSTPKLTFFAAISVSFLKGSAPFKKTSSIDAVSSGNWSKKVNLTLA